MNVIPPLVFYVNEDSPGFFEAEVRDERENIVFSMADLSLVDEKVLKHKADLIGLKKHLVNKGLMASNQALLDEWDVARSNYRTFYR